jgi:hypothetical protein
VRRTAKLAAAAAALTLGGAALAHQGPPPGSGPNMPTNPYDRPTDMAPNDKAVDSASEQIRRGVQAAAERRAAEAARNGGRARPAAKDEVAAGAAVADSAGVPVGRIESVDPDGAVVATAAGKAKIPFDAFGRNRNGLLVGMTKAEFEQLVATANQSPGG